MAQGYDTYAVDVCVPNSSDRSGTPVRPARPARNWPSGISQLQDGPVFSSIFDSVSQPCFSMCFPIWPDRDGVWSRILLHRDVVGTVVMIRR